MSLQIPCTLGWSFGFVVIILVIAGGGTFLSISDISQGHAVLAAIFEYGKAMEGGVGMFGFYISGGKIK
jgi:hypothetical protein